jgi:pilus assembly protein CpaF
MGLSERMGRLRSEPPTTPRHALSAAMGDPTEAPATEGTAPPAPPRAFDPMSELKTRVQSELFRVFDSALADDLSAPHVRRKLDQVLDQIVASEEHLLSPEERRSIIDAVTDNVVGYGPIQPFLDDPEVSEIMVNAHDLIFVEANGRLVETDASFYSDGHLRSVIERMVAIAGRTINESTALVDARLADGSRINAVVPPLSLDGPSLTIRKFLQGAMTMQDLEDVGSISSGAAAFLNACVIGKRNILISGGTGTGKTTLLNALSSAIPEGERIVTIEDTAELMLRHRNLVRLECREANPDGKGEVDVRDLVRNALRMRPDRIVVGECRGPEAIDMLQAMNTGHDGSMTTTHANNPTEAIRRLETLVLMSGIDLPSRAIRE